MADVPLSPDQEVEAQRLYELLQQPFLDEARRLARLLATKPDSQLLGKTEFEVRDSVHRLGAQALQAALEERKKGGARVPVGPARTATATLAARASAGVPRSASWGPSACVATTTSAASATRAPARATPSWGWAATT